MAIKPHIKQIKGGDNIDAQVNYVKDNLNGKVVFEDNTIIFQYPVKIISSAAKYENYDNSSFTSKEYIDEQIALLKGEASAAYDTLGEIEYIIRHLADVKASAEQQDGTKIGSITIGNEKTDFFLNLTGYAKLTSPHFEGTPTAVTPDISSNDVNIATTAFVKTVASNLTDQSANSLTTIGKVSRAINNDSDFYLTVQNKLDEKMDKTGVVAFSNTESGNSIGQISINGDVTTFRVDFTGYAPLKDPEFIGAPLAETANPGTSTRQLATTAFVTKAIDEVIDNAPSSMDTLRKISASLNNKTDFYDFVTNKINKKQNTTALLDNISNLSAAANQIIYTTSSTEVSSSSISPLARDLIASLTEQGMRDILGVPSNTGTGASGTWDITVTNAGTAAVANKAVQDNDGNPIHTTYLKIGDITEPDLTGYALKSDIKDVSVSNTNSSGTRVATISVGTQQRDINVDFSDYAPIKNPTFVGSPTAPNPDSNDNSTRIATTHFVSQATSALAGIDAQTISDLQDLAKELEQSQNLVDQITNGLNNKQDKHSTLTSISSLTTPADKMLYTTATNTYALTDFTALAKTLVSKDSAAEMRSVIGAISADEATTAANNAITANNSIVAASANNATNDSDGNPINTTYLKVSKLHNPTSKNNLGWTSQANGKEKVASLNSLAYWNGRYNSTASNLTYCNRGAFGTIVTKNVGDYLTKAEADTYYSDINSVPDLTGYLTETDANDTFMKKDAIIERANTANTATTCTGNSATTTKLLNARSISISDSSKTNTGSAVSFDGSEAVTLKLPATIKASLTGNASSATKLATARNINISDNSGDNSGATVAFNGTSDITIKLPTTIKANLSGTATSANSCTGNSATATSADSCTGNSATASKLLNTKQIKIANYDGTEETDGTAFDGHDDITLTLPSQLKGDLSGNASTATNLQTEKSFDGVYFNGSKNVHHFANCTTASGTQTKVASIYGLAPGKFYLTQGARVTVKFNTTNTAESPKLSVHGTDAIPIWYRGARIATAAIQKDCIYDFVYDGTYWQVVGSIVWTV